MSSYSKMMIVLFAAFVGTAVVACRDKPKPAPESAPTTPTPSAHDPGGASTAAPPTPRGPKLTEAECQKVVDHVLDITAKEALDEEGAKLSAKEKTNHLAALRMDLASDPELKKQARSCDDEYTRSEYVCMMAATTGEAIEKCNESPSGAARALP